VAELRATRPAAELAALEDAQHARLVAAGTPAFALGLAVRVAVDAALEAQVGLPSFADWRQQQAAGGAGERPATTRAPQPRLRR
jgi:hypothetical protein